MDGGQNIGRRPYPKGADNAVFIRAVQAFRFYSQGVHVVLPRGGVDCAAGRATYMEHTEHTVTDAQKRRAKVLVDFIGNYVDHLRDCSSRLDDCNPASDYCNYPEAVKAGRELLGMLDG